MLQHINRYTDLDKDFLAYVHRITEYSELEVTHKDHQAQLLNGTKYRSIFSLVSLML